MKSLHLVGRLYSVVFRIPVIGEPLLRRMLKTVAHLFFHSPYVGGRKHRSVAGLKSGWFRFLSRFGIFPTVTRENEKEFRWFVNACPYGLTESRDRALCDAVMDLDRRYTALLGGELEILERIPHGADRCRYVTRLKE